MKRIRNTQDLIEAIDSGQDPKYLFFWGHQPAKDGSIGKSCFSQWFEAPFVVDGERFATAEHFMMAEKARLFGDETTRARALAARTPGEAKKLGRQVADFDEAVWLRERFGIVVRANHAKFSQNQSLGDYLLGTGERVLVEASPVDAVWGIGLAADDLDAARPGQWPGLNLLGFALMEVREALRSGLDTGVLQP